MKFVLTLLGIIYSLVLYAQTVIPDVENKSELEIHNREVKILKGETGKVGQIDFNTKQGQNTCTRA